MGPLALGGLYDEEDPAKETEKQQAENQEEVVPGSQVKKYLKEGMVVQFQYC